jgi:signal-transduction protein with cAMP-binding, CBS, and nucleotidyltransferase domain
MPRLTTILRDKSLHFVEKNQTVAEVSRKMADLNVGAILVLENGKLCGLFSERDLMKRIVVEQRDPAETAVESVMSTNLVTIEDSARTEDAMARMHECRCRHLPVLHDGKIVGMVSMRDLMNYELDQKSEEIRHMRAYIHGHS